MSMPLPSQIHILSTTVLAHALHHGEKDMNVDDSAEKIGYTTNVVMHTLHDE